jgi:CheY-like chemotaxis protein
MTAYSMQGDRERCLEAGMDGYIAKPVQMEELQRELENCSRQLVDKPQGQGLPQDLF